MKYPLFFLCILLIQFNFSYCDAFNSEQLKFNISTNVEELFLGKELVISLNIENNTGEDLFFAKNRFQDSFIVHFFDSNLKMLPLDGNTSGTVSFGSKRPIKSIDDFFVVCHSDKKTVEYRYTLAKDYVWVGRLKKKYDGLLLINEHREDMILLYKEREIQIQCKYSISEDMIIRFEKILQNKKQFDKEVISNIIKIKIPE